MNIIRPVPQHESQRWVDKLFEAGPPRHPQDPEPLTYPLSRRLSQDVTGGFLYVTYHSKIIGYARIARVEPHTGDTVGSEDDPVAAGDRIVLEAPLTRMPFELACPVIRMYKYIAPNLHQLTKQEAQAALTG